MEAVNGQLAGTGRASRTEERIVAAASVLFRERGYRATALTEVAEAAGVAHRTVYVRFGTKADLLKRVIDVAIVGDTLPIDLAGRDLARWALTAPTLDERLAADAAGAREVMERIAPLLPVGAEAEPTEPIIAAAAQAGREATLTTIRTRWEKLHADGLLHPDTDLDWVVATTGLLGQADTYVLMTRTLGWSPRQYEHWRYRTWRHFATVGAPSAPSG